MTVQQMVISLLKRNWTEDSLAKKVGTSQPTIHRIKTGDIKTPNSDIGFAVKALYDKHVEAA